MSYHLGDLVNLQGTFTDTATSALVDPGAVTLSIKAPDGTQTAPTPVRVSMGLYHYQQSATQAGIWEWKMKSTGTGQAANQAQFEVLEDYF